MPPHRDALTAHLCHMDNIITSQNVRVERKQFYIDYCENERGKFLRITEESHGRRNHVIVPATGLEEFATALEAVMDVVEQDL